MPSIRSFRLTNFKGIEDVTLDLQDKSKCPVITLIGLNESGKTTLLEAISHFVSGDKSVSSLFDRVHTKASGAALIPVHRKAAFSSKIQVTGLVELDLCDVKKARALASKHKVVINEEKLKTGFEVTKSFNFEDSVLKATWNYWEFQLEARTAKGSKFKPVAADEALWQELATQISADLPQITYFPTFLVDMPNRIYLQEFENEPAVNRYYRHVFQDVLDSLGEGLSLDKHVCDRIEDFRKTEQSPNWFSILLGSPSKGHVDSVFQKVSNAVTKEVLGSWRRVFQRAISAKSIVVDWNIDTSKNNLPYASFFVTDGESRYAISERSLGFRWFFSFLLFTAFKHQKDRKTIFIFDEPAANLHAKAQAELLTSFSKIASDGNMVIYSTHSHHMINPQWLSGAYIVENTAVDYEGGSDFEFSSKPTSIKITKYRDFVSQYPNRTTYFQPVIEKLEYAPPSLIGDAPYVIVEGITDYYALKLAITATKKSFSFTLLPGSGAGSSGPLISLLMGRGERFVLLLDDDKTGQKEMQRYISEWFLTSEHVFTLATVDANFVGQQIEGLLTDDTLKVIAETNGKNATKKQIGWYLAERFAKADSAALSAATLANMCKVLDFLEQRVSGESLPIAA
ncbi:MAG: AAA family ATPase [Limisphaerales bacterium]